MYKKVDRVSVLTNLIYTNILKPERNFKFDFEIFLDQFLNNTSTLIINTRK